CRHGPGDGGFVRGIDWMRPVIEDPPGVSHAPLYHRSDHHYPAHPLVVGLAGHPHAGEPGPLDLGRAHDRRDSSAPAGTTPAVGSRLSPRRSVPSRLGSTPPPLAATVVPAAASVGVPAPASSAPGGIAPRAGPTAAAARPGRGSAPPP